MNVEQKRTLAYLCPSCRSSVAVERTGFQLLAAESEIPCPCGKSSLIVTPLEGGVRLAIPCTICGTDHVVECPQAPFLNQSILSFTCGTSGLDCCLVGEDEVVFRELASLEEAVDKLVLQGEEVGAFLDEVIMHEILSQIRDLGAQNGIVCTCGSDQWNLQVKFASVDIHCNTCGGVLRIPAATADHLEHLCYKIKLEIQGKKEKP